MKVENRTVFCSTKKFEGDDAVRTALTLDFSGVTTEDLVDYAVDALVIKWQAAQRRKKDFPVPSKATYLVPKPGTRATSELSEEEMIAKLAKRMSAADLIAAVKAKMEDR